MDIPALPQSLQAFAQILMAKKVMSEEDAKAALEESYKRFGDAGVDLSAAISRVDKTLDFMDFGIRSMKASGQNGVIYHCLVNKAADDIAKAHGSKLTDWQVDVFKGIIALFGIKRADEFHLQDFVELKANHKGVTNEDMRVFAEQLVKDFWLSRPHNSSEYRLGVRTYVELPELLKSYDLFVPQALEFERERAAYIEVMKQLLEAPAGGSVTSSESREERNRSEEGEQKGDDHHDGGEREEAAELPVASSVGRRMRSLRAAREDWRAWNEEIRQLQSRKADVAVRLQGERLSNLEQELELDVLRLERLLDRERILELLRLTDPNRGSEAAAGVEVERGEQDDKVPEDLIKELERRVVATEARAHEETAKFRLAIAGRLGKRWEREGQIRNEGDAARDEILELQTTLKHKEDRLALTVVDYLELRHAMLRAQRLSSEGRDEAQNFKAWQSEEVWSTKTDLQERRRQTQERVDRGCQTLKSELWRQIRLREDEARMLCEQHAETEKLYESRVDRLEGLEEEWKAKYRTLRRRFALETEGFRRDAKELGRRFEKARAGPREGVSSVPARTGSSLRRQAGDRSFHPQAQPRGSLERYDGALDPEEL